MKKCLLNILFLCTLSGFSQITNYNHFPTMKPYHIIDDNLDDISFAFSMRVLESDYNGPLIRLRKDGETNAQAQDFTWGDNDIVDVAAINAWRGTSNVYIHTWYDQSGLTRDALQTDVSKQPRFYPDITLPYFQGDGIDDYLIIPTPNGIQDVTNAGLEGTVLTIALNTKKRQISFGALDKGNRWSTHINFSNDFTYFDPGINNSTISNSERRFKNDVYDWGNYSFIRTTTHSIARFGGVEQFNVSRTTGPCTLTDNFAIGWALNADTNLFSTTSFNEFIMYKTDISTTQIQEIEQNAITFWGI